METREKTTVTAAAIEELTIGIRTLWALGGVFRGKSRKLGRCY